MFVADDGEELDEIRSHIVISTRRRGENDMD
jgi:hypothetical protein